VYIADALRRSGKVQETARKKVLLMQEGDFDTRKARGKLCDFKGRLGVENAHWRPSPLTCITDRKLGKA